MDKDINKFGHVIIDFFISYGWLFLLILLGVVFLTYLQLINKDDSIIDHCNFGDVGLVCKESPFYNSTTNLITLEFYNRMNQTINFTGINTLSGCNITDYNFCKLDNCNKDSLIIYNEQYFRVEFICDNIIKDKIETEILFDYVNKNNNLSHKIRGKINI